jgi:thymidylate synthase (FAD)
MKVNLISYSQGVDGKNLLDQVAYAARVSNPANQNNSETAEKLVRYLINNQHWSPLEMVSVCLEIETTRDIARQILRHRSFSFQEFSQRYADASQLGFETREARLQDTKNRQNSLPSTDLTLDDMWQIQQNKILENVQKAYKWALDNGIAKEQARSILPEGNTKSRMYMNGTLRSWVHYIQLRSANGTQKEHQEIAIACAKAIEPIFPMSMEYTNVQ